MLPREAPVDPIRGLVIEALGTGLADLALAPLARITSGQPEDSESRALLGICYSLRGSHREACDLLRSATALEADRASHHYNLALALERAGEWEPAVRSYRAALRLDPTHQASWARMHRQAGPPENASFMVDGPGGDRAASRRLREAEERSPTAGSPAGRRAGKSEALLCPYCSAWTDQGPTCARCGRPLTQPPAARPILDIESGMDGGEAFLRRWAACLVDHALIGSVWLAATVYIHAEVVPRFGEYETLIGLGRVFQFALLFGPLYAALAPMAAMPSEARWASILLYYLLFVSYDVVLHALFGQTLGKRLLRLRVVNACGEPLGWRRALLRSTVGRLLSDCPIPFFTLVNACLGYVWVVADGEQRGWHDRLFGTRVLRR